MTREVAAKVTRGFVAIGRVRDVVKALCKALQAMGAEVRLLCASPFRFLPSGASFEFSISGVPLRLCFW